MQEKNKKYIFHVHGMHCASCVVLIESKTKESPAVNRAEANLSSNTLEVSGDFGDLSPSSVAEKLSALIEGYGYKLSVEKELKKANWSEFKLAVPFALLFAFLFIFLQKVGIVNFVDASNVGYGTVFAIGIVASLSSCMAVVGGLLLSVSATFAKEQNSLKPQLMFHIGRIVSFFFLGGVIGMLGSAFTLSPFATFLLSLLVGLVMLILGINLLEIFPWAKKLQLSIPKSVGKYAHNISNYNHSVTPIILGIATFFLPCGFTQSMQLYTLTTASFLKGGLTMLIFALGTLPILALVSFSSFSIKNNSKKGVFFKTAGIIVILFSIFNIINSLVVIGVLPPVFNF